MDEQDHDDTEKYFLFCIFHYPVDPCKKYSDDSLIPADTTL